MFYHILCNILGSQGQEYKKGTLNDLSKISSKGIQILLDNEIIAECQLPPKTLRVSKKALKKVKSQQIKNKVTVLNIKEE